MGNSNPDRRRPKALGLGVAWLMLTGIFPVLSQEVSPDHYRIPAEAVVHKNFAPAAGTIANIAVAHPMQFRLANGLQVILVEDHRWPIVTAEFHVLGAGPLGLPAEERPLAVITAKLLAKGARGIDGREFQRKIDVAGAEISTLAEEGYSWTTISAKGLSDNFEEWFELTAGMLTQPSLAAAEFEIQKRQAREQAGRHATGPDAMAHQALEQALFGTEAAWTLEGAQALEATTPPDLAAWYAAHYVPGATLLSVAGDIRLRDLRTAVGSLARWSGASRTVPGEASPASPARRLLAIERRNSVQSTIYVGAPAVSRKDPDFLAVDVMSRILGGGPGSRLYGSLRQQNGFTYDVGSRVVARPAAGYWFATAAVRSAATVECLQALLAEVQRMRTAPVAEAELGTAKRSMLAEFALSTAEPSNLLRYAVMERLFRLPDGYWNDYERNLGAVRVADVLRAGRKYLAVERMQIVVVADREALRQVKEQYGGSPAATTDGSAGAASRQP